MSKGWCEESLGVIAEKITKGGTPTTYGFTFQKSGVNFLKVENIQSGQINIGSITDFISDDAHEFQKKSQLSTGDLLFSIAGTIGVTSIVESNHLPANTNQALAIIKGTDRLVHIKFLQYQLEHFVQKVKSKARGGAMNNVSLEDLKEFIVQIAPLAEQHRIVEKIEELFSELEKGVESLKTAQQQLKVYRQAVLKYAFEGKLTNPEVKEGELPEGWVTKKFGDIFKSTSGGTPSRKRDDFYGGAIPWVKSGELSKGLIVKTEEYITEVAIKNSSAKIFPSGTLLIALYGATIGKLGFLGTPAATNQAVCGIFPSPELSLRYMFHYLTLNKRKLIESAVGGAQPNISQTILKNLNVSFPVKHELQELIVSEIESRLSICDKIEESIQQGLQQSEALRQSILKRAFEGKLVPQDHNDEPASVLLDRIRAERVKQQLEKISKNKKVEV
jgi:type I restriction enzyme S subunit